MIATLQHTNYDRSLLLNADIVSIYREIIKNEFYETEQKVNKLDITQYDEINELYRFKAMKYYRTKEFEVDFLENPNNYKLEIIVVDKTKYPTKSGAGIVSGISIRNRSKLTITISYHSPNIKEVYSTSKIYYDKILYSEYAYNMQDYARDWKDFEKFSQFKCGPLFDNITCVKNLDIYNDNLDKIFNYYERYAKAYNRMMTLDVPTIYDCAFRYDLNSLPIGYKKYKTCFLNNTKYTKKRYNPYADIEEYYDSNNKLLDVNNLITTYGMTWSTTINNYINGNDKKAYVTQFTQTDQNGNIDLDVSISGNNALVSLQIDNKKIKLDDVVGYKIVEVMYQNKLHKAVLQLDIPSDALIATDGSDKFRCNKCTPTNVFIELDGVLTEIDVSECKACVYSCDFTYYVNKECIVDDFDGNLNSVCLAGIHYFYSKEKAIKSYGSIQMVDAISDSNSCSSSDFRSCSDSD